MHTHTCICCRKPFTQDEPRKHDFLGVCSACLTWANNHMAEVSEHKDSFVKGLSTSVRDTFENLHPTEQFYTVIRSMESKVSGGPHGL